MQAARTPHLLQFLLQPHQAFVDQPPVGLDLRLTRTAQKAKTATLAFQMWSARDRTSRER